MHSPATLTPPAECCRLARAVEWVNKRIPLDGGWRTASTLRAHTNTHLLECKYIRILHPTFSPPARLHVHIATTMKNKTQNKKEENEKREIYGWNLLKFYFWLSYKISFLSSIHFISFCIFFFLLLHTLWWSWLSISGWCRRVYMHIPHNGLFPQ